MQFSQGCQGEMPGHRGEMKKDPTSVLCSKVGPCRRGCADTAVAAQGPSLPRVLSGKCRILKVNDSEAKEGSTMGTEFGALGHSKQQEEHVGESTMVPTPTSSPR